MTEDCSVVTPGIRSEHEFYFPKFEVHKARHDVKSSSHFRFHWTLRHDNLVYLDDPTEKWIWVCIVSEAVFNKGYFSHRAIVAKSGAGFDAVLNVIHKMEYEGVLMRTDCFSEASR